MVTRELGDLIPTLAFVSWFVLIGIFQAAKCLEKLGFVDDAVSDYSGALAS
ncbi:hypothetical protein ACLMJV_28235 [Sinorhizobium meliloti]|uniref:hypothetical protein n=1 Tax=Rhizobium meliloti TaxID=382 RepID=UPI000A588D5B